MVGSGRGGPTRSSADFSPGHAGCCTTVRVLQGQPTRIDRHVERLRRDAGRLGLELPDRNETARLLIETATRHFPPPEEGIVRIEWSAATAATAAGSPRLRASARALVPAPERWRVRTALTRHPGPGDRRNTKQIGVAAYESARAEAAVADVDEVLLFDAAGRVVEGSFTNLLIVTGDDDALRTPALSLGPVEGIGLAIVREHTSALREARLGRDELASARELMAVNAVRGIAPIVELDGHRVGGGEPGPWARRLGPLFRESSQ
jgi:branched-subunit amino acid aminotransferase/4-amino-4-deoxychorismate lyase